MKSADFRLIVVTHRPDIGNAVIHKIVVEEIHRRLAEQLLVDAIEVCYHGQSGGCDCRKPKPGMIWRAADRLGLDCARFFMIGDRASDVEAGRRAGCTSIFIDLGYVDEPPERPDLSFRRSARPQRLCSATRELLPGCFKAVINLEAGGRGSNMERLSRLGAKIFADQPNFSGILAGYFIDFRRAAAGRRPSELDYPAIS